MTFRPNEIPAGDIDGVNTVYTTANSINTIADLIVDGAEYFDFIFSGNTITLSDAPTLSIRVDYWDATPTSPSGTTPKTFQDLITKTYNILNAPQNSTAYPLQLTKDIINEEGQNVIDGQVINAITNEKLEKPALSFMEDRAYFNSVGSSSITAEVQTLADTELSAGTTGYTDSGFLWINGNIVQYASKTDTQFTGTAGLKYLHKVGARVIQLYLLPEDYNNSIQAIFNGSQRLDSRDSRSITEVYPKIGTGAGRYRGYIGSEWGNYSNGSSTGFYSIVDDTYMVVDGLNTSNRMIELTYGKSYIQLVEDTDTFQIPDNYAMQILPYMTAGRILMERREVDMGQKLYDKGFKVLRAMYKLYAEKKTEKVYKKRITTASDIAGLKIS